MSIPVGGDLDLGGQFQLLGARFETRDVDPEDPAPGRFWMRGGAVYYGDGAGVRAFGQGAHGHAWSDLSGVPTTFAPAPHVHSADDLPAYPTLGSLGAAAEGHTHAAPTWDEVDGKPTTFPPAPHEHPAEDTPFTGAWQGAWVSDRTYVTGNVCARTGSSYVALQTSTGKDPATETTYWDLMAQKGADGSGGGGGYPPWSPDRPPVSPDPLNDEFMSDAAGWSWLNQGSATYQVTGSRLVISAPAVAGDQMRCRVRSIPDSTWSITAKICVQPQLLTNYVQGGLILRNSGTGKMLSITLARDSAKGGDGWALMFDQWNSATSFSSNPMVGLIETHELYMRLISDGANIRAYYSIDGIVFTQIYTQTLAAFIGAVDQFGIYAGSTSSTSSVDVICDWIRKDWAPTAS